ncbi:MAG: hypothetical protein ABEH89_00560 [bacterium]
MRRLSLFLALAVILTTVAIGLGYRLLLTKQGRSTDSLRLNNENSILKPQTIGDISDEGRLTLLQGREIFDVLRAQIPINPHLSAPLSQHGIKPTSTYLIFSERSEFEKAKSLINSARVFSNHRGTFNGVLLPNAMVLESPLPVEKIRKIPLQYPKTDSLDSEVYLLFRDGESFKRFIKRHEPSEKLNLLLPATNVMNKYPGASKFLRNSNSFSILGKNAVTFGPDLNLQQHKLVLLPADLPSLSSPPVDWFQGLLKPPERRIYLYALPIAMAALGFLGLIMRGYPLRWGLWAFIGGLGFLVAPNWHLFLAGLITSGLLQFGLRLRGASVPWFVLAGTAAYAFTFQPYLMDPFHGIYHFWTGFLLGLLTTLSGWTDRIRKNPTYGDVIALGLGLLVLSVTGLNQYQLASLTPAWLSITLLPAVVSLITAVNRPRHWPWIAGMTAWFILFYRAGNTGIYLLFLLSMVGWLIVESFRRFLVSGTSGRRPI